MKFAALASWNVKRLLILYGLASLILSAVVAGGLYAFVLSPQKLMPFNPVSEEVYWVPAQAQIALERLNGAAVAALLHPDKVPEVRTRLAILRSKLHEMTAPSEVRDTLQTIRDFEPRRQALTQFVTTASRLAESGKQPDILNLVEAIDEFRNNIVSLALDARTMEVDARLSRDHEVTKTRQWLYGAFMAMWLAMLVIGWLALSRIVTKDRELAAQTELLEAKKLALDAAVAAEVARNTFLGKVSHEFNSPLQAMLTNIQLLEPRLPDERSHTIIRRLMTSLNQLRVQVSDLLDVAEIKSGKLRLRLSRVDVGTLISDIVSVHQVAADSKGLSLIVNASPMQEVYTDGRRIAQIVTNLVTNAIRHTETGGVTVRGRLDTPRGGTAPLVLTVADTGMGFAPEVRANLFQPFVQAKRYRGGTGLGLAIVKGLVDQFNGTVSLTSKVGAGSTFVVEIPVALDLPEAGELDESDTPLLSSQAPVEVAVVEGLDIAEGRKPTILVVEDNSELLDTLSEYMSEKGFSVHAASSLQSGKAMLGIRRYAAIITDMELGDGFGTDIAQAAKEGPNSDVPIICCTAYSKLLEGERAQVFDVRLAKPVSPDAIFGAILRLARLPA